MTEVKDGKVITSVLNTQDNSSFHLLGGLFMSKPCSLLVVGRSLVRYCKLFLLHDALLCSDINLNQSLLQHVLVT